MELLLGSPSLPSEIIDTIASNIPLRHDLLSLALAHSSFRDVIIPVHLHHRIVECAVDDGSMWDYLQENPRYMQSIRSLKLLAFSNHAPAAQVDPRIPPIPSSSLKRSLFPINFLQNMPHLLSFEWRYTGDDQDLSRTFASPRALDEYTNALLRSLLQSCPTLEELVANDSFAPGSCPGQAGSDDGDTKDDEAMVSAQTNLVSIDWTFGQCGWCDSVRLHTDLLPDILKNSPGLQTLSVNGRGDQSVALVGFDTLRFPQLTNLTLAVVAFEPEGLLANVLPIFLDAHPSITTLCLNDIPLSPIFMTSLPHLASLRCNDFDLARSLVQPLPEGGYRPVAKFYYDDPIYLHLDPLHDIIDLRGVGSKLRDLELAEVDGIPWERLVPLISFICPALRRLILHEINFEEELQNKESFMEAIKVLAPLQHLKVLSPPTSLLFPTGEVDSPTAMDIPLEDVVDAFTSTLPEIRFLFPHYGRIAAVVGEDGEVINLLRSRGISITPHCSGVSGANKWSLFRHVEEEDLASLVQAMIDEGPE